MIFNSRLAPIFLSSLALLVVQTGAGQPVGFDDSRIDVATGFPCSDADGDGVTDCAGDCDDTNPGCTFSCTDTDGDGFCDPQDCDDATPDPPDADADGDGIPDACDNCPTTPNPDQLDFDGFTEYDVAPIRASGLFAADLDGDGDVDLVSSSAMDDTVVWHRNDGTGTFGPTIPIANDDELAGPVWAADLDGDTNTDVLSAGSGSIAWYRNQTGDADPFGPPQVVESEIVSASHVSAVDMDGDSDLDILAAFWVPSGYQAAWYENLDGAGSFGAKIEIADLPAIWVSMADLDGDDDLDIIAGATAIAWKANHGAGNFGPARLVAGQPEINQSRSGFGADIDADGDTDIVAYITYCDQPGCSDNLFDYFTWYENLDGHGTFGPQRFLDLAVGLNSDHHTHSVHGADMNGDGRTDVLASAPGTINQVEGTLWYEYSNPADAFVRHVVSFDPADSAVAADFDGDGNFDVSSALQLEDRIPWYRSGDGVGIACDNCPDDLNADQLDSDLDGSGDVCDCAPFDPGLSPPFEISSLNLEHLGDGAARLSWPAAPWAEHYGVTRVRLADLAPGHYGLCLESDVPTNEYITLFSPPASGTGYGYLVNGSNGTCGSQTLGFDSDGEERINLDPAACP